MRTRDEHIEFCKQRAREYLERGELAYATTSMIADLDEHPETRDHVIGQYLVQAAMFQLAMFYVQNGDTEGVRRWIEGFR